MTQEERELLLKDLSARLPYEVKGTVEIEVSTGEYSIESGHLLFIEKEIDVELLGINKETMEIEVCPLNNNIDISEYDYTIDDFIPYLRPISSMMQGEWEELSSIVYGYGRVNLTTNKKELYLWLSVETNEIPLEVLKKVFTWLNEHHFDYNDLIKKGLALEAPEGMYEY